MRFTLGICAILGIATLFTGCSTPIKQTYTSHGKEGYQLVCGGFFETGDLSNCYQKAGELCTTRGYTVTQTNISSIIVECKTPDEVKSDSNGVQENKS